MLADINNYVVDIVAPLLFGNEELSSIETALHQWYSASIDYIGRCISDLKDILPNFLHASLLGRLITVPTDPVMEVNLRRFAIFS